MPDRGADLSIVANVDGWTLVGEIDAYSAPSLASAMSHFPDVSRVVVDFAGVTFTDSSGLRVLVDASRQAKDADKVLVIAHSRPAIRRVIEISGLTGHLDFAD